MHTLFGAGIHSPKPASSYTPLALPAIIQLMHRPCFLVLDPEHAASISTRKLVIETAKFNVLTAYSAAEAVDTLRRFPGIDAAVIDTRVYDLAPAALIEKLRELKPNLPVVVVSVTSQVQVQLPGTYVVDSLNPRTILDVLRTICPAETNAILEHDKDLEASGQ